MPGASNRSTDAAQSPRSRFPSLDQLADRIERDRREPDKVLLYVSQLRGLAHELRDVRLAEAQVAAGVCIETHARQQLAYTLTPDGVDLWLTGASRLFDGQRPIDLLRQGGDEARRVLAAIENMRDGSFA